MPEWDDDVQSFLRFWFAGLVEGLESVDAPARRTILRACGNACARSYTAEQFQQAWQSSIGMADFLRELARRFPEASYTMTDRNQIQARYNRCACDLARLGLVTHPLLCDCSAQNLESNFSGALGKPVSVALESAILRGAEQCCFTVTIEEEL